MKKSILIIFSICCAYSYAQNQTKKVIEFHTIRNAEFGYLYTLPTNIGKEIIGKSEDYEIVIYNSNLGDFQINLFSEKDFKRNEKAYELNKYFEAIRNANHLELQNAKIGICKINIQENMFIIYGKKGKQDFIWKTIISEIPVSGEFGFNTMIFYYTKKRNKEIGLKLIEEFGKE
jgi:hypothetical protein